MSHSKQKGTNSSAEWHFWALKGHLTSLSPNSRSIFLQFLTEIRFLTFCVSLS